MTSDETTHQAIDRLWTEIDRREDELIETVAELVRRPSPLGAEAEAQEYVAQHLAESGLDVEVWDLDESIKTLPQRRRQWGALSQTPECGRSAEGVGRRQVLDRAGTY